MANPLTDMYADVVTTVVLEVQSNPSAQKGERRPGEPPLRAGGDPA